MTAQAMLCPDCHSEVTGQDPHCLVCSPEAAPEAQLWVRASWMPGTLDQVELALEGTLERSTVSLGWIHRNLGEQYGHDLYLKGKARFACNHSFWQALSARSFAD